MSFKAWFNEVAGYTKEGEKVSVEDINKLLRPYAKPWHYMTYMTIDRPLVNNPSYHWGFTPQAIYGYPVSKIVNGFEPGFGEDRPLITVFKVKEEARPKILNVKEFEDAIEKAVSSATGEFEDKLSFADHAHLDVSDEQGKKLARELDILQFQAAKAAHPLANMILKNAADFLGLHKLNFHETFRYLMNALGKIADDIEDVLKINKQFSLRRYLMKLGLRGVQVGPYAEGGKLGNEAFFFFSSDLQTLNQFVNKKGYIGYAPISYKSYAYPGSISSPVHAVKYEPRILKNAPSDLKTKLGSFFSGSYANLNNVIGWIMSAKKIKMPFYHETWPAHRGKYIQSDPENVARIDNLLKTYPY